MFKKKLILLIIFVFIIISIFNYILISFANELENYEPNLKKNSSNTIAYFDDGTYQIVYSYLPKEESEINKAFHLTKLKYTNIHNDLCKYKAVDNKIYTYGLKKYVLTNITTETTIRSYYLESFDEADRIIFENLDDFITLCDNDYRNAKIMHDDTLELLGDGSYQIIDFNNNKTFEFKKWLSDINRYICEYKIVKNKIYTMGNITKINKKYTITDFINHDYLNSEFLESNDLSDFNEEDRIIFQEHKDFIKLCDLN